jgi:hypothetical protein
VHRWNERWEAGIGGAYRSLRFRLAVYAGGDIDGEIEVTAKGGRTLHAQDVGSSPTLAVSLSGRFRRRETAVQPAIAAAARTSVRTCSVSSALSPMNSGEVFTE